MEKKLNKKLANDIKKQKRGKLSSQLAVSNQDPKDPKGKEV